MTDPGEKTQETLLKELLTTVSTLQQEVANLKVGNGECQPHKRPRDGDGADDQPTARIEQDDGGSEGSDSDPEPDLELPDRKARFALSEEGEAFFEATFKSKMEYATRKAKAAKYGQPDSRWTRCPRLGPVVEGTLSSEALKQDKVAYRSQEMWLEAVGPLAAILERAGEDNLTLSEVIPMVQASLMLMGDASHHQSSQRRQHLLQHFNPQLKKLMNDQDFEDAAPYLFGEDFAQKAKSKLESAAALRKAVYQPTSKGKTGFHGGYSRKQHRGYGGSRQNNLGPGKYKKRLNSSASVEAKK